MKSQKVLGCDALLGQLRHAILIIAEDGTVLQQEGRLPSLLGYADDELVGRNALEFVAPSYHELVAFVFADEGFSIARTWFQPYDIGLLDSAGEIHHLECEPQSMMVDGSRLWLVTLRSHRLQSSSFQATRAHHANASALEVAGTVASSMSDDWVEAPQICSFVVAGHDNLRFASLASHSPSAPPALVESFASVLTDDAPWNRHRGRRHMTVSLDALPDSLAAVAADEGFVLANVGVARVDGRPSIGIVSFGRHELSFAGNTDKILQESLSVIEMTLRREQSDEDPLTRLGNRTAFAAAVERREPNTAVLYIDLDKFKPINDTFGHAVGDTVLVKTARRIASTCRPGDVAARLGGDEFAVLLANVDRDQAISISQEVLDAIRAPLGLAIGPGSIDASGGLALSSSDGIVPVEQADLAMLHGKRSGRGQLIVADH